MEEDTCITEYELEVVSAMSACGIPASLRVHSISSNQSVAVEDTYVLPSSRFPLGTGTVTALEPPYNEGAYRAIPANARVLSFTVTPITLADAPVAPAALDALEIILVTSPYSTARESDAQSFPCISLTDASLSAAVPAKISLARSVAGKFNPLAERGLQTTFHVLTPTVLVGGVATSVPVFSPVALYPAVHFVGGVLPPEVNYTITIAYEVSRAM
jgi:hypothetical protein